MRVVRIVAISVVSLALGDQAHSQQADIERYKIVRAYAERSAADSNSLMFAPTEEAATAAAKNVALNTDQAFQQLIEKQLLDGKLSAYQVHWNTLKPVLVANPRDELTVNRVAMFRNEFAKAAKGDNCTAVISASKGEGATVYYAKAQDAASQREYKQLDGTTTIISELERAEYKFKSYRKGKETGQTAIVACTSSTSQVKVVITE